MPIYAYLCKCGKKYEILRDLGKAPKTQRCVCGKKAKRDYSQYGGFLLVGPGWPGKELTMTEVVNGEHSRNQEFKRRRSELRQDGVKFPYYGDQ